MSHEEGLRKRRTSISNLMKDVEKIETASLEFQPNEASYTNEIRTILSTMHEEDSFISKVLEKIRKIVTYP